MSDVRYRFVFIQVSCSASIPITPQVCHPERSEGSPSIDEILPPAYAGGQDDRTFAPSKAKGLSRILGAA